LFPADILGLEPVCYGGVLLSTPLHAILDLHHLLNVIVQLANKMGLYTKKIILWAPSPVIWIALLSLFIAWKTLRVEILGIPGLYTGMLVWRLNTGVMVIIPASLSRDARFSAVAVVIVY
jgi:hypothetical protein